jgi:cytoplasmic iron level regulating protein YaaA (DUF328/UPF0246 family)
MKILFSPAEAKKSGGQQSPMHQNSFLFPELYDQRLEVLHLYNDYIKSASDEALSKIFGIKDSNKCKMYQRNLFEQPLMKVIERYDGVAFDYLGYEKLSTTEQAYIDDNVIIFSNLFGPMKAGDMGAPEYKLKQGEKIGDFAPESFYKKHFTQALDAQLSEPYLDLRAGFYNKFYKPSSPYTTVKFLKQGKVVSHWAKAYRGVLLRYLAQHNIKDMASFMKLEIEGLRVSEVNEKGMHTEVIYFII